MSWFTYIFLGLVYPLLYGGLIGTSRLLLPRIVTWYGIFLCVFPILVYLWGIVIYTILFPYEFKNWMFDNAIGFLIGIPYGLGHLAVALGLFLEKQKNNETDK